MPTTLTIQAAYFAALIKHVQPTAARASVQAPVLRAVRFVIADGRLTAYSTDRYVIAAASYPVSDFRTIGDGETLEFYLTAETLKLTPKGKAGVVDIAMIDDAVHLNDVTLPQADVTYKDWPVGVLKILSAALAPEDAPVPTIGLNAKYLSRLAPAGPVELVFHGHKKAIGVFVDENRVGAILPMRLSGTPVAPEWVGAEGLGGRR